MVIVPVVTVMVVTVPAAAALGKPPGAQTSAGTRNQLLQPAGPWLPRQHSRAVTATQPFPFATSSPAGVLHLAFY